MREHTEVIRPPRALWVPFMMGRPLGAPNEPEFQRRVLLAALQLFEEPSGPVLRDFPDEAPVALGSDDTQGAACPVNFSRPKAIGKGEHALAQAFAEEIAQLQPWHDLALEQRGGSTGGLSGLTPDAAGAFIVSFLGLHPAANYRPEQTLGQSLKYACDDLRTFYEEAATAQPGHLSATDLEDWFYFGTTAGEVLRELQRVWLGSDDKSVRLFAELTLIPRSVAHKARALVK